MNTPSQIAAIILAAGRGTRMGQPKPLIRFKGRRLLEHTLDLARTCALTPLVVVLGHAGDTIQRTIDLRPAHVAVNPQYASGQSRSVQTGIAALPGDCRAALFLLVDQPLVRTATVTALMRAYQRNRPLLTIATHKGQRGNPVIVDASLFERLHGLTGDTGPRALFNAYRDRTTFVAVDDPGIHLDVDTPADLMRLRAIESETGREP